jgi:hypothetical protein
MDGPVARKWGALALKMPEFAPPGWTNCIAHLAPRIAGCYEETIGSTIREHAMKVLRMAAVFAVLAGPAYAQMPNLNLLQDTPSKTDEEKAADAERDKAYKETLKKIPDAKTSNDPWGSMRSETPKAAPKTVTPKTSAKKTKAGSIAN